MVDGRAGSWTGYASHDFGANLNDYYHSQIEIPFFNYYLKGKGNFEAAEATFLKPEAINGRITRYGHHHNAKPTPYYFNDKEN